MWTTWAAWAGLAFAFIVLIELVRLNFLLYSVLKQEPKLGGPIDCELPRDLPVVSVIVPAKDEEPNIERVVKSVQASEYPRLEIVLVNDRSSDRTLEIMEGLAREDPRITVVTVTELPQGWTGKTHALVRGANRASGEILVFTDADTVWDMDVLCRTLNFFIENDLDMLSLLPGFLQKGFNEIAVYPHLALGFSYFYPLTEVNDQTQRAALASGCFIMIRRHAYEAVGTWQRFKDEITEDVAMSKAVKAKGLKLNVLRGWDLVRTKSFDNLADLAGFWKRTYYGGLERSVYKIGRLAVNYVSLAVLSILFVLSGTLWVLGQATAPLGATFLVSSLAMTALMLPFWIFVRQEQGDWTYGLTAPIGVFVSAWVAVSTLVMVLTHRGIQWRGTVYK